MFECSHSLIKQSRNPRGGKKKKIEHFPFQTIFIHLSQRILRMGDLGSFVYYGQYYKIKTTESIPNS